MFFLSPFFYLSLWQFFFVNFSFFLFTSTSSSCKTCKITEMKETILPLQNKKKIKFSVKMVRVDLDGRWTKKNCHIIVLSDMSHDTTSNRKKLRSNIWCSTKHLKENLSSVMNTNLSCAVSITILWFTWHYLQYVVSVHV